MYIHIIINKWKIYAIKLIIIHLALISCESNSKKNQISVEKLSLDLINKYAVDVEELSGLDLAINNKTLWTVSDKYGKIYQLDLTGRILKEISIPGIDLEGITVDAYGHTFWVVQESLSELLQVDTLGNRLQNIYIANASIGSSGLEGITLNTTNNHLFLLKEKDPSLLMELNPEFEVIYNKLLFTALDYSGMDYDYIENELWIISDQNKMLYQCDTRGYVLNSYMIDVDKAEGIAYDSANKLIYIVSDSADSLYVYWLN